jgi:uncharacterized lipoprotein YehR (DUF1307 family)
MKVFFRSFTILMIMSLSIGLQGCSDPIGTGEWVIDGSKNPSPFHVDGTMTISEKKLSMHLPNLDNVTFNWDIINRNDNSKQITIDDKGIKLTLTITDNGVLEMEQKNSGPLHWKKQKKK